MEGSLSNTPPPAVNYLPGTTQWASQIGSFIFVALINNCGVQFGVEHAEKVLTEI